MEAERCVVLAFRGTASMRNVLTDINISRIDPEAWCCVRLTGLVPMLTLPLTRRSTLLVKRGSFLPLARLRKPGKAPWIGKGSDATRGSGRLLPVP